MMKAILSRNTVLRTVLTVSIAAAAALFAGGEGPVEVVPHLHRQAVFTRVHSGGNVQRDREVSPLATADEAVVDPHFGLLIDGVKVQQRDVAQKALRHRERAGQSGGLQRV